MRRLAVFVVLLVFAAAAWAQFDTANVLGTVTDPSGAVIAGCHMALRNTATSVVLTAETDDRGEFRFIDISVGRYELKATAAGFQAAAANFDLTVGARQRVDVQLRVATVASSVTATAEATQLETESSERGQVVNEREIAELPLNGRQYSQLVELTAGVVPSPSELGTGYGQREGSFNINGLRSVFNNYLLDGLDNNMYGTSNQGFSNQVVQLSPDAVAEFQVVTNNMSAEYGRSGGATINVVTRYGTNEWHGRVWEFLRNTDFDATGFFKPDFGGKPALHQNQFGGTLGGPIKKDKIFFFLDYEGFRQSSSFTDSATLPTAAERGLTSTGAQLGYYLIDDTIDSNTQATGTLPIDNPCPWGAPNPCNSSNYFAGGLGLAGAPTQAVLGGTQYINGHIPASAVIPYAAQIMQTMLPSTTNSNLSNNYIILHPNTFDRDKGDVKVDYDARRNLRLFTRYSQARFNAYDPGTIQGMAGLGGDGHVYAPVIEFVGGATWTINPVSVLEARFGFSRMKAGKTPPLAGGPSMAAQFGNNWSGLPSDPQYTGGISYVYFFDGGFTNLGRLWTSPQYQNPTVWNPKANYTRLLPGHTLKAGIEYTMLHVAQQDLHPVMGGDIYGAQMSGICYTGVPVAPGVSAYCYAPNPYVFSPNYPYDGVATGESNKMFDYADFLLGYRSTTGLSNSPISAICDWGFSGYLQDDWKVNRRLTVNLGMRYEFYTPIYEANNKLSNFDLTTKTMKLATSGDRFTVNPNTKDFGPRVGAAFTLTRDTVLRGGFGISYSHWNRVGSSYLTMNAPYGITTLEYVYPGLSTYLNTQSGFTTNFVNTLLSATNYNPQVTALQYMPPDSPDTQVRSWFFSVQQAMGHNLLVDVAYVGNNGINEVFFNDINQASPQAAANGTASLQSRIFGYPGFGSIVGTLPWGTSNYNSLQAKVEKRFTSGLYLLNSFTWSKAIDIAAQSLDGGGNCDNCGNGIPSVQNIYEWQADRGISSYNHPLVNSTAMVWTLPVGKGHWLGGNMNRAWNATLGGWQMTNILQARSGDPLTMAYNPNNNTQVSGIITISGRNAYRPNLTGSAVKNSSWAYNSSLGGIVYLNPGAYSTPTANAPFGNSPRNAVRGFGFWQLDTGLTKDFPLTEKAHLQFRAEAFNITNKTNYGDPNTMLGTTFGVVNSALPARELQLAAKIVF
ncbi:MAG: carboxypeptidase regulatory-like domain-containing protein [Terracidiphilus sp.]|jgi:hypothetical protein